MRPRVLSGIQPTSDSFHLGNYIGALRNWVAMQDEFDAFYFIPDLHSITMGHEPAALRRRTRASVAQLIAIGLDPGRCTLFVQSHVPEHAELGWVLGCITGFGEASRMTQFKDRSSKGGAEATTVGLFNYPVLQAADVLLYQADKVPVGEDQRQHIELTRDLAQRFNTRFGQTFTVPEPHIVKATAKILDLAEPAMKMSKSAASQAGVLDLLEDPASLRKKIRSAVTDTGREVRADGDKPGITNLLLIASALSGRSMSELEEDFVGVGYGDFKAAVAEIVVEHLTPIRERYAEITAQPASLDAVIGDGAAHARAVARETMALVRESVGFLPMPGA
ncbi:MAG TPA: tryptophan--tRNA ligase [Mycobacteriales bacterium]|nr:tryptophan--tRNA ligase [Mycobacteriales bacterium]